MAKEQKKKVYFWLKLDQNFFKNLAIKQALRMPGGKDMIIVYQMLMLESLATDGVIYYEGMLPTLEKELAVRLDVQEEDIQMTLAYFKNVGLVQVDDSNNAEMLQVSALIEQETDWARYKREQRRTLKLDNVQHVSKKLDNVQHVSKKLDNVQHVSNGCPTELELELELEKDIDINIELEVEVEVDSKKTATATDTNIYNYYQQRIGSLDGYQYEKLRDYLNIDRLEPELIKKAIDKGANNSKRNFGYINTILKNWAQNGILTVAQQEEEQRQFEDSKGNKQQSNDWKPDPNYPAPY